TRKMEDPELKLFRMTPVLCNNKKRTATRLRLPTLRADPAAMTAWTERQSRSSNKSSPESCNRGSQLLSPFCRLLSGHRSADKK
ncbi:hypothetical protein, partial [Candidatus Avelusimicrobium facis]|uniref:hypothetical protein n=1 Tax=Candidatus Avelusimicrobium facis TaxID=3416203 RepID=UPI003D0FEB0B